MPDSGHRQALPPGHSLGHYRLLEVLGVGGFGVTYLGRHLSLGHQVAVKEYLPNEFAVRDRATVHPKSPADLEAFEWGLSRFLDEARTLTRFRHPNLVRVSDYFEANNTAYIVMDYEDGKPLDALLKHHGTLTEAQLKRVLLPVADGLRQVHAAGFLHRDIKPSNIFVRRSDESPVLLDFGSARQALGRKSKSMTTIASAGYSPPEQYEGQGAQGAWTDIYALAALCYRAVTGDTPMEAPHRQSQLLRSQVDPLPRLAETASPRYSQAFLKAVDWGLRVIEAERPQSLDEWLAQLGDAEAGAPSEEPKPTARSAGRRAGRSKPSETADRPAAQKSEGFGAKAAWLVSVTATIGVVLYFALAYWQQGSGQDQETTSEVGTPMATVPRTRAESGQDQGTASEVGDRFRDCPECPEMVVVPAGTFRMGAPESEGGSYGSYSERPVHTVSVRSFAAGVYEVTFAEWDACVSARGCGGYRPDDWNWGRGRRPVIGVSWDDAQLYVQWLLGRTGHRYRLLSESEWEYAARAGTTTPFHTGPTISTDQANYNGNYTYGDGVRGEYRERTVPVGSFSANGFGLHDVHGNVWEWVQDCYYGNYKGCLGLTSQEKWVLDCYYGGAPSDGSAWESNCSSSSHRILRGGSWSHQPEALRSASRGWGSTGARANEGGFRVARTLTP